MEGNTRSELAAKKPQIQAATRSPLLDRMATFLPTLRAANAELEHAAPSGDAFAPEEQKDCSEHSGILIRSQGSSDEDSDDETSRGDVLKDTCEADAEPRIEMNLTCGLLDLQNGAACSAAEANMQDGCSIEDALGNAVKVSTLEHPPQLFVDGSPTDSPASDSDRAKAASNIAVGLKRCSEGATGRWESCVETRRCSGVDADVSEKKTDGCSTDDLQVCSDRIDAKHLGERDTVTITSVCNPSVSGGADQGVAKKNKIEVLSSCDT